MKNMEKLTVIEGRLPIRNNKLVDFVFTESEKYICREIIELWEEDDLFDVKIVNNPNNYSFDAIKHIINQEDNKPTPHETTTNHLNHPATGHQPEHRTTIHSRGVHRLPSANQQS